MAAGGAGHVLAARGFLNEGFALGTALEVFHHVRNTSLVSGR